MNLKSFIHTRVLDGYAQKSYAQEGEDMVLRRIFEKTSTGFYVDIGAHHPKRYSNTYYFYQRGWRGINVDATPGSMVEFARARPSDINIEAVVANEEGSRRFHLFAEPALNTLDDALAKQYVDGGQRLLDTIDVKVVSLGQLLREYLPANKSIDFLSIDVEGADLAVLQSNDWSLYRPTFVLAEAIGQDMEQVAISVVADFMRGKGYSLFAKTVNTVFFKNAQQPTVYTRSNVVGLQNLRAG